LEKQLRFMTGPSPEMHLAVHEPEDNEVTIVFGKSGGANGWPELFERAL
jgi:hypothetical protein